MWISSSPGLVLEDDFFPLRDDGFSFFRFLVLCFRWRLREEEMTLCVVSDSDKRLFVCDERENKLSFSSSEDDDEEEYEEADATDREGNTGGVVAFETLVPWYSSCCMMNSFPTSPKFPVLFSEIQDIFFSIPELAPCCGISLRFSSS